MAATSGQRARIAVLLGKPPRPTSEPFPGPYLAQKYVTGGTRIHKVYVVGGRQFGLIKRWPRPPDDRSGEPYAVDEPLAAFSRLAGSALDLDIYGVDFLFGPHGPAAIDVNPFPSCEGIPGAAETRASYLLGIAAETNPRTQ